MVSSNTSSRPVCIRIFLQVILGLLILLHEAHSTCPSVCRCGNQVTCGHQNLSAIPVGLPDDTRTLYLIYNKFTKLAAGDFSSLSHLEELYLYNNHISDIEDGAFRGLSSLKLLSLDSNNINRLTNRTFEGAPNLEEIYLRNNHLPSLTRDIFSQVPRLRKLDLASNGIEEFPNDVSQDLRNVENLDLSNNSANLLLTFSFGEMVALQHLILNDLSEVNGSVEDLILESAFDGLLNLRNLELTGNRLTKIPTAVKFLPNLTAVSFYLNSIQSVNADDFHQPSLIEWLDLEFNSLAEIPTSALAEFPHLTDLYLGYNPIPMIPPLAFLHNPRLARLSVGYTNLTTIDKDGFVGLGLLDTLYLSGNILTTIVDGAMNHVNPEVNLELVGNPLRCDCHLRGFADWLINNHTGTLNRGSSLQCVTPDRLNSTAVTDLRPNQFACQPRSTSSIITISALASEVSLPCAIDADPALQIYWITNNHEEISSKQSQSLFVISDDGSLLITNVSLSMEGLFTCVVSNDAGEARHSVAVQITSSPSLGYPTKPSVSSSVTVTSAPGDSWPTGGTAGTRQSDGLVFGAAGIILAIVLALLIIAASVVRRRYHKTNPGAPSIPLRSLPPIPSTVTGSRPITSDIMIPCASSAEGTYEEIPATGGYSTRITEPRADSEQSPDEIEHTYFSRVSEISDSKCDQGLKGGGLTVKIPDDTDRYSAMPSPSTPTDGYMTMKPQIE